MSVHDLPSPDPIPWGAHSFDRDGEFDALLLAWAQVLRQEGRAEELVARVRALKEDQERRLQEMGILRQASYVLSALDRVEPMALLARDLMTAYLKSPGCVIWVLGEHMFEPKASLGIARANALLEIAAPNPFPDYPLFIGQCQSLSSKNLPPSVVEYLDALGDLLYFVPLEHQNLLVGFGLFQITQDPPLEESAMGAWELLLRLFAASMHQAWNLRDLKRRRDALAHASAEEHRLIESLRRENLALGQGQGYRMEFLGYALDQLRPILGQVMGSLTRLKQDPAMDATERDPLLLEALLHGKRMAEFLRDLTDLARPGRIQNPSQVLPMDLQELLTDVKTIVACMPREEEADLDWPDLQDLPEIMASRDMLRQVLLSLCHGAIQHNDKGSLHFWIEREPMHLAMRLLLEGLETEAPSRSLHRTGSFQPTELYVKGQRTAGLGLVITEHLVRSMGGSLRLDRDFFGQGTVVSLEFPIA